MEDTVEGSRVAAAETRFGGVLQGGRHRLAIRVYYEDTDFSGVVYHAGYLRFLERGRTEFLRALGFTQSALHAADADAVAFVVRRMTIDFLKPARMDDVVTVETRVAAVGGASLVLPQRIVRDRTVLVDAEAKVAALAGGRAQRLPALVRGRLSTLVQDLGGIPPASSS